MSEFSRATPSHGGLLAWVTPERIKIYSLILITAYVLALIYLAATSHGGIDYAGRPLGTDFSDVWTAGRLALAGHPASVYDPAAHYAAQQAAFHDPGIPFYGWHYPPMFLLVASLLALLPYLVAVAAWQGLTLPLYLVTMRGILPEKGAMLLALAFPAVFMNLTHGQNGFLTAALIGGGLLMLDRRPWLAGVLFGLLAYKPQFGVLLPLALLAEGRWRTILAAGITVIAAASLAYLVFGVETWRAFLANTAFTRHAVLEQGGAGFWKIQSVFAAVRLWGGSIGLAYAVQAAAGLAAALAVFVLWRSKADPRLKAAGLIVGAFICTPYGFDYDFMALAPAGAFLVSYGKERGLRSVELAALALAFAAPMITRTAGLWLMLPLGMIAVTLLLVVVVRRGLEPQAA
ncbi:MAG TPA: glycosyltransferase family 87 protein [Caulobacteraceae bacterium]